MPSDNEVEHYSLINKMGASEVPKGGPRVPKGFKVVDILNRPAEGQEPVSGRQEVVEGEESVEVAKPDPVAVSSLKSGPAKPSRARKQKAAAQPREDGGEPDGPDPILVDIEYGALRLNGVEVIEISEGDSGEVFIATKAGAPFSFKLGRSERFSLKNDGKTLVLYSTGFSTRMLGHDVSVFISIGDEEA